MARWNTLEDSELDTRTIYVAGFGFRDSDTINQVWGRTQRYVDRMVKSAIREYARMHQFEDETLADAIDQIAYYGDFTTTVGETIEGLEESTRADEFRDDVRTSVAGYVY